MPLERVGAGYFSGGFGSGGMGHQTGPIMRNTTLDEIAAQGNQQRRILQQQQQGDLQRAGLEESGRNFRSGLDNDTQRISINTGADTARRGQDFTFTTAMRGYDVTDRGNEMQNETARRNADLQFQASMAPVNFARERFDQVLPLFTSAMRDYGSGGERVGGVNTPTPSVTVGGVYTPSQVQQQVNDAYARNAEMADTQRRLAGEKAGARGMGVRSPLVAAMQAGIDATRMGADQDAARQIRFDAAGANAKQQTASEGLRGQLWAQENDADIRRRQVANSQQSQLLAALASIL